MTLCAVWPNVADERCYQSPAILRHADLRELLVATWDLLAQSTGQKNRTYAGPLGVPRPCKLLNQAVASLPLSLPRWTSFWPTGRVQLNSAWQGAWPYWQQKADVKAFRILPTLPCSSVFCLLWLWIREQHVDLAVCLPQNACICGRSKFQTFKQSDTLSLKSRQRAKH